MTERHRDDGPTTFVREITRPGRSDGDLRAVVPALTILWHYDLSRIGERAPLGRLGTEVRRRTPPFDQTIDAPLSRDPFLYVEYHGGAVTVAPRVSKTSVLLDGQPLTGAQRIEPARLKRGVILLLAERILVCLHQVRTPVLRGPHLGFVGGSDLMEDVRRQIRDVADLDIPVLIRGASGTGKELVARAIVAGSPARTPYVAVNLAERASTMVASELFGHQKGAFTGATIARSGYFVEADGGTLFIDEVGDLPLDVQTMLLRVVEDGEVRPIGGGRRSVRVRLLSATDRDLEASVSSGTFKAPLLNRIRGCTIDLPLLAERREDVGLLLLHFLKRKLGATGELHRLTSCQVDERLWLGAFDVMRIAGAAYPGNLRDLESLTSEIVVGSRGKPFAVLNARAEKILAAPPIAAPSSPIESRNRRPGQPTDADIRDALRQNHNNFSGAAKTLGISRTTLYERTRLEPSMLRFADDLTDEEVLQAHARHAGNMERMANELGVSPKPLKSRLIVALKRR